jgi:hypothetical protein
MINSLKITPIGFSGTGLKIGPMGFFAADAGGGGVEPTIKNIFSSSTQINSIYVGSTPVTAVYVGSTLVWEA